MLYGKKKKTSPLISKNVTHSLKWSHRDSGWKRGDICIYTYIYKWGLELQIQTLVSGFYLPSDNIQTVTTAVYIRDTQTPYRHNSQSFLRVKTSKTPCSPWQEKHIQYWPNIKDTFLTAIIIRSRLLTPALFFGITCEIKTPEENQSLKAPARRTFSKEATSQICWVSVVRRF